MATITIAPAAADRFDDAEHALTGGGDGTSCQCQWWTMTNAQFQSTSQEERRELLRDEVTAGPPPALIAYVDGEAAGWIRVGPRDSQVRIGRTKAITGATPLAFDDPGVWSVSCFVVRKEYRGLGLNAALLAAAVDYAREGGARVIEGYPIDLGAGKRSPNELFHGVLSVFEGAGFTEVARPKPHMAIVTLEV